MEEIQNIATLKPFCEIHKKSQYQFARLSFQDNESPFLCSMCLIQREQKDPVISIEEVLFLEDSQPISNWPPGIDQKSQQFLKWKKSDILKGRMRKGIMEFYERLRSSINEILHTSEKEQLLELDEIKLGSEEVIQFYNSNFKRKELLDVFANPKSFEKEKYLNILGSINEVKEKDLLELSKQIDEKKDQEITFREQQQSKIDDMLDEIILKINELSIHMFQNSEKEENNSYLFEDYEQSVYWTFSQNKEFQINQNDNQIKLEEQINHYENKSTLMFEKQDQFDLIYEQGEVIKISNPKKQNGYLEIFYTLSFSSEVSFTIKFNTLTSLQNFQFKVLKHQESRELSLTKLLNEVMLYFKYSRNIPLEFKIIIKENSIEIQRDGFSQKEDIFAYKQEELDYYFSFWLDQGCEGFELSNYQFL